MINKTVTTRSGRKIKVDFFRDYNGIIIDMEDYNSGKFKSVSISEISLCHMVHGEDYPLIIKHEVGKFEYELDNPSPEITKDPAIKRLEDWDGKC